MATELTVVVTVETRTGELRVVHALLEQDVTTIVEVETLVVVTVALVLEVLLLAIAATLDRKFSPDVAAGTPVDPLPDED